MIPRLANRTPRTKAVRGNMGQPRLESLAAEFALLAQRRSRAIHQIETLDQQRSAAIVSFAKLQRRIAWLVQAMDQVSPDLRDPAIFAAPEPEPPPPPPVVRPVKKLGTLAAIGRQWAATQPPPAERSSRPNRRT